MGDVPDSEEICTNCGKEYRFHMFEPHRNEWFCYTNTTGDVFTTEPTEEDELRAEITRLQEQAAIDKDFIGQYRTRLDALEKIIAVLEIEWQPDEDQFSVSDRYLEGPELELIRELNRQALPETPKQKD